jgi:hypothetical protein
MDSAMQYNGTPLQEIQFDGHPWRIFDKPAEGRLMITPSIGRSVGEGVLSGLTLGAADTEIPKPDYQAAVAAWLRTRHGGICTITDGYKLIKPQWEFKYHCA